jgi:hypothetical protein
MVHIAPDFRKCGLGEAKNRLCDSQSRNRYMLKVAMKRLFLALATLHMLTMALVGQQKPADTPPSFRDFPVPVARPARIAKAYVDPSLLPESRSAFNQRLGAAAKGGPDFAGHYTVVSWHCGSACVSMVVVDCNSLKVVTEPLETVSLPMPDREVDQLQYKPDSTLLIVDAFLEEWAGLPYGKRYYVWNGRSLQLIRTVVDQAFTERIRKMDADFKKQR